MAQILRRRGRLGTPSPFRAIASGLPFRMSYIA
jgi:hypothetical protein